LLPKLASTDTTAANALVPGSKEWLARNKAKTDTAGAAASSGDANIATDGKSGLLTKSITTISVKVDCDSPKFFFIEKMDERTKLVMNPAPDEELTSRLMTSTRQRRPVSVLIPRHSVITTISYSQIHGKTTADALFAVAATSMVVGEQGSCLVVEGITCLPLGFRWMYLAACSSESAPEEEEEHGLTYETDYYGLDSGKKKSSRGAGVLSTQEADAAEELGKIIFSWSTGTRVYDAASGTGHSITADADADADGARTVYSTDRPSGSSRMISARNSKRNGPAQTKTRDIQPSVVQADRELISMVDALFNEWV